MNFDYKAFLKSQVSNYTNRPTNVRQKRFWCEIGGILMEIQNMLDKVINGDCLEVMKQMPSESVDLVITSPPYNLRNNIGGGFKNPDVHWRNPGLKNGYDGYTDDMPYKDYILWQTKCVAEMFRLLKPNGAIFYNNKNRIQGGKIRGQVDNCERFSITASDYLETCGRHEFQ